jgi:hypothetical protein
MIYTNNVGWPLGTAAKTTMINIAEKLTEFLNFYLKAPNSQLQFFL